MFRKCEAKFLLTGIFVFSGAALSALTVEAATLVPHRAVYDLVLDSANERSGIDGMYGRMVYEFSGSECAGYTSTFRFVTAVESDGMQRLNDQRTQTFEDLKSGLFRFETQSYADDVLSQEVSGEAIHSDNAVEVKLDGPQGREVALASSRFPTEHIRDVLEKARGGSHFFESRIFDGSEEGDKTLIASASIGDGDTTSAEGAVEENARPLEGQRFWPVSIAYFDDDAAKDDEMPIYNMSFKLYENGISSDLTLDYGDFVLTGHLAELDMLDQKACQ